MKKSIFILKKYLYYFILIRFIKATTTTPVVSQTIAFALPSCTSSGLLARIIYSVLLGMYVFFMMLRKSFFIGLQKQAFILQGLFFGIDIVLNSIAHNWFPSVSWLSALISSPICAILSVNDRFLKIFMSMINALGIVYISAIVLKLTSTLQILIIGAVLYFILVILVSGTEKAQFCFGKIFTVTISILSILQMTTLINIFEGLHGVQESIWKKVLHYGLSALIFVFVGLYFVSFTYFSNWAEEKVAQVETAAANAVKKDTPETS